jgi:hypothetical protein
MLLCVCKQNEANFQEDKIMNILLIMIALYFVEILVVTKGLKNMDKLDGIFILNVFVVLALIILQIK